MYKVRREIRNKCGREGRMEEDISMRGIGLDWDGWMDGWMDEWMAQTKGSGNVWWGVEME